jgi:hypothetical protein
VNFLMLGAACLVMFLMLGACLMIFLMLGACLVIFFRSLRSFFVLWFFYAGTGEFLVNFFRAWWLFSC